MQVNFDLISGLKISTIYNDIFCCFYNIQAIVTVNTLYLSR